MAGMNLQKDDALEAARLASKPAPTTKPVYWDGVTPLTGGQQLGAYQAGATGVPIIQPKSPYVASKPSDVLVPSNTSGITQPPAGLTTGTMTAPVIPDTSGITKPPEGLLTGTMTTTDNALNPVVDTTKKPNEQTTTAPPKTTVPSHVEDKIDKIVSTNIPGTAGSNGSSFNYDSSQDPAYKQAAANLENQIVQSMVGRGGLYSSVTQQEVQNGLQNLEVQFREQRHSEWMAERDQVLQEAQFALTKSESEYSRWRDRQASAAQSTSDALANEYANLFLERNALDAAIKRFEEGKLTSADASLLGFPGVNAPRPVIESAIASKERAYQTKYASYMNRLKASDNAEAKLAMADEIKAGSATSEEPQFTTEEVETLMPSKLGTSAQASAYRSEYSKFITGASDLKALEGKLSNLNYNSASLIKTLGDALYYRLVYEAEKYYYKKANA